jgi:hypothetical protein
VGVVRFEKKEKKKDKNKIKMQTNKNQIMLTCVVSTIDNRNQ